jgi:hypothetical protein
MHVRQSLRCRDLRAVLEGAFIVQFCIAKLADANSWDMWIRGDAYSTNNSPTSSTLSHHISCTSTKLSTGQPRNPDSSWSTCDPCLLFLCILHTAWFL